MFIEKNFIYNDMKFCLKITHHFLKKRKNQKFIRGRILFNNSWQIINLLQETIKKHPVTEQIDKDKIVIILNKNEKQYGFLIKLEKDNIHKTINIILITIDEIDTRHFNNHLMFGKEKNRFYMLDYKIPISFSKRNNIIKYSCNKYLKKYNFIIDQNSLNFFNKYINDFLISSLSKEILIHIEDINLNYKRPTRKELFLIKIQNFYIYFNIFIEFDFDCISYNIFIRNPKIIYNEKTYLKDSLYITNFIEKNKLIKQNIVPNNKLKITLSKKSNFLSIIKEEPEKLFYNLNKNEKLDVLQHLFPSSFETNFFNWMFFDDLTHNDFFSDKKRYLKSDFKSLYNKSLFVLEIFNKNEKKEFDKLFFFLNKSKQTFNNNDKKKIFLSFIKDFDLANYINKFKDKKEELYSSF